MLLGSALLSACGGSSANEKTAAPTAPSPAGTATPDPRTQASLDLAAKVAPALLQATDVPADFQQRQNRTKQVSRTDVPGLATAGATVVTTYATADDKEFVTQIVVIPDDGGTAALLDRFASPSYVTGLTGNAKDATSSPMPLAVGPAGAKAINYAGTVPTPDGNQLVQGQAVGFVHDKLYIVVLHASYGGAPHAIDVGAIAKALDDRLASVA